MNAPIIHRQVDPLRRQRGYRIFGSLPDLTKLKPREYDPDIHCEVCRNKCIVFNHEVNKHRKHYMQYVSCRACKGTGRKTS